MLDIKIDNVTIGADPEVFLNKNKKLVSAYGLVEGTKKKPCFCDKGALQVDGIAAEFNIDPARNKKEFVENILTVMDILQKTVGHDTDIVINPVAEFGIDFLESLSREEYDLGCSPDFNAHSLSMNRPPEKNTMFRTGAGHIHIGYCEDQDTSMGFAFEVIAPLVRELDIYLGVPSILIEHPNKRRELYGKAGCFRPKKYGVEYRTLSNFWLKTREGVEWVYENTFAAIESFVSGKLLSEKYDAQAIIDNNDLNAADELVKKEGIKLAAVC